jgi:2-deoxy-D-gluconate 3-dehydrogenase
MEQGRSLSMSETTGSRTEQDAITPSPPPLPQRQQVDPANRTIRELFDLTGKTAIVTGAASGIGFGIATRLAEAGARVMIADVDGVAAETAAGRLKAKGWLAQAVRGDVRAPNEVAHLVEAAVGAYGGLDILVNNAGIYPFKPVLQMAEADWDRVLDINLKGTFLCAQAAARQMVTQGRGGVIVNIASIDAFHPSSVGLAHYDASKGGVVMFTKNLALELAPHGIRVMAIAPGGIATPGSQASTMATQSSGVDLDAMLKAFLARIPVGRMGTPDDIGRVALFLASEAAAYMTGSTVFVDGGVLLS